MSLLAELPGSRLLDLDFKIVFLEDFDLTGFAISLQRPLRFPWCTDNGSLGSPNNLAASRADKLVDPGTHPF
jgi:hypothetical protein